MFAIDPNWRMESMKMGASGLKVFDFHPIHVALNTVRFERYQELKIKRPLPNWTRKFVRPAVNQGAGPQTLLKDLLERLSDSGVWMRDLVETCSNGT